MWEQNDVCVHTLNCTYDNNISVSAKRRVSLLAPVNVCLHHRPALSSFKEWVVPPTGPGISRLSLRSRTDVIHDGLKKIERSADRAGHSLAPVSLPVSTEGNKTPSEASSTSSVIILR